MTIIVAIKCTNGVIVACDSRTTDHVGKYDDTAIKLHKLKLADGNLALVAEAGNADFSSRAIEHLVELIKAESLTHYRAVSDCAEKALAQLKTAIRAQCGSAEEIQKFLHDNSFEWMIVHYWQGKPLIFTLSLETGISIKHDKPYCAIGCGSILADFLISKLDINNFGIDAGLWTATYVVHEIKNFDFRCGGEVNFALAHDAGGISNVEIIWTNSSMAREARAEALNFSEMFKLNWKQMAEDRIRAVVEKMVPPQYRDTQDSK